MRSILTALQEGRLFELPEAGKDRALEFLARILDANPDIDLGTDAIEEIKSANWSATPASAWAWPCRTSAPAARKANSSVPSAGRRKASITALRMASPCTLS